MKKFDIQAYLDEKGDLLDGLILSFMPPEHTHPGIIHEAMHYSLFSRSKKIRPILAMATAEALGLICMAQTLNPGTPVIFGIQCYGSDMKTGNISIGSPAYALQAKYCAAMARYYGVPSRAGGSVTDAKSLSAGIVGRAEKA